jgi:RNA polymerase sigma-70 factor, ECF subfamily
VASGPGWRNARNRRTIIVDEQEFKKLYDRNARRLYNFILWTTGNSAVCDDVLQNVFVKVWRCALVPADEGEQTAWLYAVTRNACIDYFRGKKKFVEYNDAVGGTAERSDAEDDGRAAWNEVRQLPENERAIVYLHLKMGYSYAEIARLLSMTENNVRVKAFRALRRLREILIRKGL